MSGRSELFRCGIVILLFLSMTGCGEIDKDTQTSDLASSRLEMGNNMRADFDSLGYADSLFAKGEYFYQQQISDSAIYYDEAASKLYWALANRDSLRTWRGAIVALSRLGETYRRVGDSEKARLNLNKALEFGIQKLGAESREVAGIFHNFGNLHFLNENPDSALFFFEKALFIRTQLFGADHSLVASVLGNMGVIYLQMGNYDEALKYLSRATEIKRKILGENHYHVAMGYHNAAVAHDALGQGNEAIQKLKDALRIYRAELRPTHPGIANCYNVLGASYSRKGFYEEAMANYLRAEEIFLQNEDEYWYLVAMIQVNIGRRFTDIGDDQRALEYFRRAEKTILAYEDVHSLLVDCYKNMGEVFVRQNDMDKALFYLEKALLMEKKAAYPELSPIYVAFGDLHVTANEFAKAMESYENALNILLKSFGINHYGLAEIYYKLGSVYSQQAYYSKAHKNIVKALQIARRNWGNLHPQVAKCYQKIGELYENHGMLDRALQSYHNAILSLTTNYESHDALSIPADFSTFSKVDLLAAITAKINCLDKMDKRHLEDSLRILGVLSALNYALALVDSIRIDYSSQRAKFSLMEASRGLYEKAIEVLLNSNDHKVGASREAFAIMERSKAATLLESISFMKSCSYLGIPDSLISQEYDYRRELNYVDTQLKIEQYEASKSDSLNLSNMETRLFELKRSYEALIREFEAHYPDYYELKYKNKIAVVEDMQQALDAHTTIIEYFYGDSAIYIFALTKDSLEVAHVKLTDEIEKHVTTFRDAAIHSEYEFYIESAHVLYQILLAPVSELLAQKLLIIPGGKLTYLPFEAFLTEEISKSNHMDFGNLPYLLNKHVISYQYSGTLWLESHHRLKRKELPYDYVAFAPVNWDSSISSSTVFETFTANRDLDPTRGLPVNLPSTRREVLDVEAQFNKKYNPVVGLWNRLGGNKTRVFLDHEATEVTAKRYNLKDYRYIHFATHGFVSTAEPTLSGLLLGDRRDSSSSEDGVLRLGEIYNLDLNAELVILSACETGYGKLTHGEGLLGLARGFIYAGAKNLVVSLWQVDVDSPSELIPKFFNFMLNGYPKNAALRDAKLALIRSGTAYAEPKHWAPFILIGQ